MCGYIAFPPWHESMAIHINTGPASSSLADPTAADLLLGK